MKKAIGYIILIGFFALMFTVYSIKYGVRDTAIVFVSACVLAGLIILAAWLITSD